MSITSFYVEALRDAIAHDIAILERLLERLSHRLARDEPTLWHALSAAVLHCLILRTC